MIPLVVGMWLGHDTTAGSGTILGNYAQIFEAGVQSPGVHLHPGGVIESEVRDPDSRRDGGCRLTPPQKADSGSTLEN